MAFPLISKHYHAADLKAHMLEVLEEQRSAKSNDGYTLKLGKNELKQVSEFVESFTALPSNSRPVYRVLAELIGARANCLESGNTEWFHRHGDRIEHIMKEHAPSGSGVDSGTQIDDDSTPVKLIFKTAFHHMHESGMYDGWTHHDVIVTPDFSGFNLRITGRDRNGIKDYLSSLFHDFLNQRFDYSEFEAL